MIRLLKLVFLILLIALFTSINAEAGWAKNKPVEPAPSFVLERMQQAKAVFVGSAGEDYSYTELGRPPRLAYGMLVQAVQHWGYKLADSPAQADLVFLISAQATGDLPPCNQNDSHLTLELIDPRRGDNLWENHVEISGKCHWFSVEKAVTQDYLNALAELLGPLHQNPVEGVERKRMPYPGQLLHAKKVLVQPEDPFGSFTPEDMRYYEGLLRHALNVSRFAVVGDQHQADVIFAMYEEHSTDLTEDGQYRNYKNLVLRVFDPSTRIILGVFRWELMPTNRYGSDGTAYLNAAKNLEQSVESHLKAGK